MSDSEYSARGDARQVELAQAYRLSYDAEGNPLLVRGDGVMLSSSEITEAYNALRRAYQIQRSAFLQAELDRIMPTVKCVFPMSFKELKRAAPCVYFATTTARTDCVKIGLTSDVFKRRKTLCAQYPGNYQILAYLEPESDRDVPILEEALLAYFSDVRDGRTEFVGAEAANAFLAQFRGYA